LTGSDGGGRPQQTDDELNRLRAENEELRSSLEGRRRWRRVLAIILVVLTSVSLVAASVAVWARGTAFSTDRFMEAVGPALEDPAFYDLIGDRAGDPVIEALAVEDRLEEALAELDAYLSDALLDAIDLDETARDVLERFDRPELQDLAPPIAAAINERIDAGIHAFFTSEAFTSRFPGLVRRVHEAVIAVARDSAEEHPNVYVEDGEVRVNLIPFIAEALRQLGDEIRSVLPDFELPDVVSGVIEEGREQLEEAIQASLPEDFGQVSVMSAERLTELRTTVTQIDRYVWVAAILSIILLVLALVVSPNRRRTTLHLGIGIFTAVVLVVVIIRRLQSAIVEEITDPRASDFARNMLNDLLSGLRTLALLLAIAAIIVAIIAYVSGRPDWMGRLTRSTQAMLDRDVGNSRLDVWITDHAGVLRVLGILLAAVALFFTGLDLVWLIVIGVVLVVFMFVIFAATNRVGDEMSTQEEETTEV
jgi:hypothetical protein